MSVPPAALIRLLLIFCPLYCSPNIIQLNFLRPERVRAARKEIQTGQSISLE